MISVKMYRQGPEVLVAACDSDILGKTFRGEGLKICVSEGFYKGDIGDEDMLVNRLEMATIANLVGKKTLEIAVRRGFVDPSCVLQIGGVPHAQMARMM
ncbi:MAG: DUF424 domain-containing protein [Thermoplasmata archaeon]|jgi:hypothetical protein|nr:DUF424 domain-containing protein [Thermoplasmata archaeon]